MLRGLLPGVLQAWLDRRDALRELKSMVAIEQDMLVLDDSNPLHRAMTSLTLGDRAEALRCWQEACERLPEFVKTSHDSLQILIGLQRYDEAESLMLAGCKRAPRDSFFACGYAEIASRRNDHSEAAKRWAAVRKTFPTAWQGFAYGAASLSKIGRNDEAERVLAQAVARFPGNINCRLEHARMAELRQDWNRALERWELVSSEFNHVLGVLGTARAMQELGRLDDADAFLAAARLRFPTVHNVIIEQARLAQRRGDEAAELALWEVILQRFPLVQFGYYEAAQRLTELDKSAEADDVLRRAVERFPQEVRPMIEYATFANKRGDWTEAAVRWEALRHAHPDQAEGYIGGADAVEKLGRPEEAARIRAERTQRRGASVSMA